MVEIILYSLLAAWVLGVIWAALEIYMTDKSGVEEFTFWYVVFCLLWPLFLLAHALKISIYKE